jgi:hypothetical protein
MWLSVRVSMTMDTTNRQEFAPVPPNKQFIHLLPLFNIIEQLQDAIVKSF